MGADSSKIEQDLEEQFNVIETGASRTVVEVKFISLPFEWETFVIKLPLKNDNYMMDGKFQNNSEVFLWEKHSNSLEKILCPIVAHQHGSWVMMPKFDHSSNEEMVSILQEKIKDTSLVETDIKKENIGVYNGEPYLIDYALACVL